VRATIVHQNQKQTKLHIIMENDTSWENRWKEKRTFWDTGVPHPELQRLVKDEQSELYTAGRTNTFKQALVPGCGSGYDVFTLCQIPSIENVIGLDLAPTANQRANELKAENTQGNTEKAEFLLKDFYSLPSEYPETFDLLFDYTFLCAMEPSIREQWADTYSKIISRDGKLITIIFPLKTNDPLVGPPYQISFDLARELLEPRGFQCVYHSDVQVSIPSRQGSEQVAIWQLV
jgi:SAM-dependent methyltransferase